MTLRGEDDREEEKRLQREPRRLSQPTNFSRNGDKQINEKANTSQAKSSIQVSDD
jgi:hypothetical protein